MLSEIVDKQVRYWNDFLAFARRQGNEIVGARGPYESTANELLVNVGGGAGVDLRAWMDRRKGFVALALYLYDEGKHDAYRSLESKRSVIDASLGGRDTEWRQPGVGRPAGYVAIMRRYADPMDESDWEDQFEWLQAKLERFSAVFQPIVVNL